MPEPATETQAPSAETAVAPQPEGRRTQLKILREGVDDLRADVWKLTRSHESKSNHLEAQVKSLRKELATHAKSKEVSDQIKQHMASTKKLEKQLATMRAELAAMKGSLAKESARSRAREEAAFSRILAKVSKAKAAKAPAKRKKS